MADTRATPEPVDRLAPARRPDRRAVMVQSWRSLLFMHWALPPAQVRPLVPAGLGLDLFAGDAYVGLVFFTMRDVRPVGLPSVPWLSNFHETNLRTYVHVNGRDPGVYFFSLEAANPVAVVLARSLFSLPYHHATMTIDGLGGRGDVALPVELYYTSKRLWPGPRPATSSVRAHVPPGTPAPAAVGTLDHFLIERYLLYTTRRGRLISGQVHHHAYPVQGAEVLSLDESLMSATGLIRPARAPLAHFSSGVDVEIFLTRTVT